MNNSENLMQDYIKLLRSVSDRKCLEAYKNPTKEQFDEFFSNYIDHRVIVSLALCELVQVIKRTAARCGGGE